MAQNNKFKKEKKPINKNTARKKKIRISKFLKILLIVIASFVMLSLAAVGLSFRYIRSVSHTINTLTTTEIESILAPVESPTEPATILIMGLDTRDGDDGRGRADTIILFHIDPVDLRGSLLSIPRDTLVEIPEYGKDKINAAYAYGGEELMIKTVSNFLDAEINHYITLDFDGFVKLIDALGGVNITIDRPMTDPKSGAYFSAGNHHFTGEQALAFTRDRSTELADIGRIQRQQYLFRELINQKLNVRYLSNVHYYFNILVENTRTDLSIMTLLRYSKSALSFDPQNFETAIIPSHPDWIDDGTISVQIPDIEEAREMWKRILRGEPASRYNTEYTDIEEIPDSMAMNAKYDIKVKVKNTGAITWERDTKNPVFIGYHWIDFEKRKMVLFDGERSYLPQSEVKPGEEVIFNLKVKSPSESGKYILQIDLVQEGITWFSYQGVPPLEKFIAVEVSYSARYHDFGTTPTYMEPGEKYQVTISVKNTGFLTWRNDPELEINMGYHWLDRDTREVIIWDDGRRMNIKGELKHDEEFKRDIFVFAPDEPGRYILQYDMVHERVTWFSDAGVLPLEVNVDVGRFVDRAIAAKTNIKIYNGNGISGTATKLKEYLKSYGFKVIGLANADSFDYEKTIIYYTKDNEDKAKEITFLFDSYKLEEISSHNFEKEYGEKADIAIIFGRDYLENLE